MSLASIVNITIQAGTATPTRRGFGVPCLLGYHTRFADTHRFYRSLSGMVADGFTADDPVYAMAAAIFSQNPRPERILVARLPTPATPHTVEIDVAGIVSGETVTLTVVDPDGTETEISQAFTVSADATATALASDLDAIAGIAASATGSVVTVDADVNGEVWRYRDLVNATILDVTASWAYDDALSALLLVTQDFYAIAIDVNSDANIDEVAAWALANERLAFFGPQVTDPADYTATANPLRTGTNTRAVSLVRRERDFAECAWMGECLPFDPGSQTWSLKSPAGVAADTWTESEITTLETDNSNHATSVAGLTIVRNGITHGGEWIDVVRGLDWLTSRLQERVYTALVNARKIPYTDDGAAVIANAIRGVLRDAENKGLLTPGSSTVTTTRIADIPTADRAARRLTGVEFQAELAGAVHSVQINGAVA